MIDAIVPLDATKVPVRSQAAAKAAVRRRFAEDGALVPELLVSGPTPLSGDYFLNAPDLIAGSLDIVEVAEHSDLRSEDSEEQAENSVAKRSEIVPGSAESLQVGFENDQSVQDSRRAIGDSVEGVWQSTGLSPQSEFPVQDPMAPYSRNVPQEGTCIRKARTTMHCPTRRTHGKIHRTHCPTHITRRRPAPC